MTYRRAAVWRERRHPRSLSAAPAFLVSALSACGTDTGPGVPVERDAKAAESTGDGMGTSIRMPCPHPPIPEGELQNQASGPSAFGMAVGGDSGLFDPIGGTECGLPDVRICALGTEICTFSDAAGQFVLNGLPADEDLEISFEKADCNPALRLVQTGGAPVNLRQTRLITRRGGRELLASVGEERDDETGGLVSVAIAAAEGIGSFILADDVVMTILPSGKHPLYSKGAVSPSGLSSDALDPELRATRLGGWGMFVNIDPGAHTVRFERGGKLCDQTLPGSGLDLDAEGNVRVTIRAGYMTTGVAALCL